MFTAGVAEEDMYPGDWLAMSHTDPAGQGPAADGFFRNKSLGTADYIYVLLLDTGIVGVPGLQCGVLMGKGLDAVGNWGDVTAQIVLEDDICVFQYSGVHPNAQVNDNNVVKGDKLIAGSGDAGEVLASTTEPATDGMLCGIALSTDFKYKRITAADQDAAVCLVRCGF